MTFDDKPSPRIPPWGGMDAPDFQKIWRQYKGWIITGLVLALIGLVGFESYFTVKTEEEAVAILSEALPMGSSIDDVRAFGKLQKLNPLLDGDRAIMYARAKGKGSFWVGATWMMEFHFEDEKLVLIKAPQVFTGM